MKRGLLIGGTAIASAIGSLMYSVGSFLPAALVGQAGSTTLDPASFGPVNSGTGPRTNPDPGTNSGTATNPDPASGAGADTFTGDAVSTRYGTVQVQISVSGSSITDVKVLQAPTGRNARFTNYAMPILISEAMTAQSAEISSVSGASYTSYGFINSLASAISQM